MPNAEAIVYEDCDCCSRCECHPAGGPKTVATTFTMSVAGFVSDTACDCEAFNGDWTLTLDPHTKCRWQATSGDVTIIMGTATPATVNGDVVLTFIHAKGCIAVYRRNGLFFSPVAFAFDYASDTLAGKPDSVTVAAGTGRLACTPCCRKALPLTLYLTVLEGPACCGGLDTFTMELYHNPSEPYGEWTNCVQAGDCAPTIPDPNAGRYVTVLIHCRHPEFTWGVFFDIRSFCEGGLLVCGTSGPAGSGSPIPVITVNCDPFEIEWNGTLVTLGGPSDSCCPSGSPQPLRFKITE